jgi:hypothetical protein
MICGSLAKMIFHHRAKLPQCGKPDVPRKSMNRRLGNLAMPRDRGGTFESHHFRPLYDLPRDALETVGKDDMAFCDQLFQFL